MTEHASEPSAQPGAESPPVTGLRDVDAALGRLADLDEQPVAEHHDRLAAAHEALHDALQTPPNDA